MGQRIILLGGKLTSDVNLIETEFTRKSMFYLTRVIMYITKIDSLFFIKKTFMYDSVTRCRRNRQ